jgi:hypothetical protein
MRREVVNNSFRADIFITLQEDKEILKNVRSNLSFIAIEVKIKDWKQGLYQAWRYKSFAEKSYLAVYKPYAKNIDIKLFEQYNVGLIIFGEKTIEIKNHPKKNVFKKKDSYSHSVRGKIIDKLSTMQSVQPVFQK